MRSWRIPTSTLLSILALGTLPASVRGDQILKTSGFSTCLANSNVVINNVDIQYNNNNKTVSFNVAGSSTITTNVTATLNVTAYGNSVYSNTFNPCDASTFVSQLCPLPAGSFSATGTQAIPPEYASQVPAIAFQVPDIAAQATLELKATDSGKNVACLTSDVTNGKTFNVPAVPYVAAAIAGAAMVLAGVSAIGAAAAASGGSAAAGAGSVGAGTLSPSFVEVFSWFQGIAMNGMLSVNYPPVYRSFTKNFAFSAGIIPWTQLQTTIDHFRSVTGGNLTDANVQSLQNATANGGSNSNAAMIKRAFDNFVVRDLTTSFNSSTSTASNSTGPDFSQIQLNPSGIGAFVESLAIPSANTFMTVLLVVAVVVVAIAVGILLFKLILEGWALFGSFPRSLAGFRKHYWGTMARSIVQLILILYGVWVLYCIFQFTHGDSWAAKVLAGVTLGIFTGVLVFFIFKISQVARRSKEEEGDVSLLYEDKKTWTKYSLFYDAYRKNFWWTFIPAIVYMFAKGCVLAAADGHGLAQTIAQLVIEGLMLILLVFTRPYERKSGNIINIFIQVVRALSVICILVFVEELGIAQTTQTITGVVLIAVQSVLTGVLAILIAVNAIIICCKENPHRKRRKEAEKLNREFDDLTSLDPHNSLLMESAKGHSRMDSNASDSKTHSRMNSKSSDEFRYEPTLPVLTQSESLNSFASNAPSYRYGNGPGNARPTVPYGVSPYLTVGTTRSLLQNAAPFAKAGSPPSTQQAGLAPPANPRGYIPYRPPGLSGAIQEGF